MMSRIGSAVNLITGLGFHLSPFISNSSLLTYFLTMSSTGAVIHRFPVGFLRLMLLTPCLANIRGPWFESIRFMYVPRNLALFSLALVIRVFSIDNLSFTP